LLIAGFPSDVFGTNCYVVAPGPGEQCLVIDPGLNVVDQLDALLDEHRLRPAAVLLTHGHLDHTFSVTPVCGARGISAYIHPDDKEMLADPTKGLSTDLEQLFGGRFTWTEPSDVEPLTDGKVLDLAGVRLTVDHAPGHTRGSVLFHTEGDPVDGPEPICFSGDVLFAGSIGRTDLPGGDMDEMRASLRDKILPLHDNTVVLPGHGPTTTIGQERATNPFLREFTEPPRRGW
jgi:hydroxyacylglutathione hydrolase